MESKEYGAKTMIVSLLSFYSNTYNMYLIKKDISMNKQNSFYYVYKFGLIAMRWAMTLGYKPVNIFFYDQFNIVPLKDTFRFLSGKADTIVPFDLNKKKTVYLSITTLFSFDVLLFF